MKNVISNLKMGDHVIFEDGSEKIADTVAGQFVPLPNNIDCIPLIALYNEQGIAVSLPNIVKVYRQKIPLVMFEPVAQNPDHWNEVNSC